MKKSLLLLSGAIALGGGTVASVVSSQESKDVVNTNFQQQTYSWDYYNSVDKVAYDLTNNQGEQVIKLPELLNAFKEMQRIYLTENNINYGTLFNYSFLGDGVDTGDFISQSIAKDLIWMLSSKEVQFNDIILLATNDGYHAVLRYSLSGSEQLIRLFSYVDETMPKKQDNLEVGFTFYYNQR